MQKENEVVESKDQKYIGQGCYNIGESQYGKLFAEIKNAGYNEYIIRMIVSADESNVHDKFREVGLLSDVPQLKLTKSQITFQTLEAAHDWLEHFAEERGIVKNWT